jgi:hypothetical protein
MPMNDTLTTPDLTAEPPALVTGDAAQANAAIEAWLARRAAIPEPDWEGYLAQIRDGLIKLTSMPLIQGDPDAGAILVDLATAEDMEQFAVEMDRLALRVSQLLGGSANSRTQASILSVASLPSWTSATQAPSQRREEIEPPARMVLRL